MPKIRFLSGLVGIALCSVSYAANINLSVSRPKFFAVIKTIPLATVTKAGSGSATTTSNGSDSANWSTAGSASSLLDAFSSDDGGTKYARSMPDLTGFQPGSGKSYFVDVTGFFTSSDVPQGGSFGIAGVQVTLDREKSYVSGTGASRAITDETVKLIKTGSPTGSNKADTTTNWPVNYATKAYGSSSDLWGLSLSPADVIASNFGVRLSIQSVQNSDTDQLFEARLTSVTITVWYTYP